MHPLESEACQHQQQLEAHEHRERHHVRPCPPRSRDVRCVHPSSFSTHRLPTKRPILSIATISVLRRSAFGDATDRFFWRYEQFAPGVGHCVTTYRGDGSPLPAFEGEPYLLPLTGGPGCIANTLWAALNDDNRVALAVKLIDPRSFESEVVIINRFEKA